MIRSDFVSNSSSSSFIFITQSEYNLPDCASDISTNNVDYLITVCVLRSCNILHVIDDEPFRISFFKEVFRHAYDMYDVKLEYFPRSLVKEYIEFGIFDYNYGILNIKKHKKEIIKLLKEYFKDILDASVVKFTIEDYNNETGEWQDESIGYDYIPSECLFEKITNNH